MEKQTKPTIGLPRALLYHRYGVLWQTFFEQLGFPVKVSQMTSLKTMEDGIRLAVDESCLSFKLYLGHVQELVGQCDYILVPRISSFGMQREFCVRFSALADIVKNTFRDSGQRFLTYNQDGKAGITDEMPFLSMGQSLGCSLPAVHKAYKAAVKANQMQWKAQVKAQEKRCREPGLKILLAAHSYVLDDAYIGTPVLEMLHRLGVTPVRADIGDRNSLLKHSHELSSTCKWEMSRELIGGVSENRKRVQGIILLSAFPCGPDSMVNELLMRRVKEVPVLNLVLDGLSGTAGVETRLESFVDIIRFQGGELS